MGELDIRLILGEYLPSSDTNDAAAGWDGGRYSAVESSDGVVLSALTIWDSETQAQEAADAFADWLPRRFGRRGSEKRVAGLQGKAWEAPDGAAEVVRKGNKLLVIVGPSIPLTERARQAFHLDAQAA